jgi:uroporphyrinogen decarboxylase
MPHTATLTSRERVNRALTRQDHDRVPRHETFWGDTIRRWQGEGLEGDGGTVLDRLGSDFLAIGGWNLLFPGYNKKISEDDETITYVNGWLETVREWKGRSGTPEHIDWGCKTREAWEETFKPALDSHPHDDVDPEAYRATMRKGRDAGKWCFLNSLESFEALRHLLGDVECMIHLVEDPEWIAEISRGWTDCMLRRLEMQLEACGGEIDGVWCYGDMAFNHSTMCSPDMYREVIWPDHKRMTDWAHEHGAKFIFHTDGNVNGVMDLYLEAGFDALQPLEAKAHMDVRDLAPTVGDRLSLFGNIDVMTMSTNDLDKIEAEIASKFAAGKAANGYLYHSDHSVPPAVSWETYQGIIDLVEKHGWYE